MKGGTYIYDVAHQLIVVFVRIQSFDTTNVAESDNLAVVSIFSILSGIVTNTHICSDIVDTFM